MKKYVKYIGEGEYLFVDWNWLPKLDEVKEVDVADGQLLGPYLEEVDKPITETEELK